MWGRHVATGKEGMIPLNFCRPAQESKANTTVTTSFSSNNNTTVASSTVSTTAQAVSRAVLLRASVLHDFSKSKSSTPNAPHYLQLKQVCAPVRAP